jgi:hypothetical protein
MPDMTEVGLDRGHTRGPRGGVSDPVRAALRELLADDRILRLLHITVEHVVSTGDGGQLVLDWGRPRVCDDAVVQRLTVFVRPRGRQPASEDTAEALLTRASAVLIKLGMGDRQPLKGLELREVGPHQRVFDVRYRLSTRPTRTGRPPVGGLLLDRQQQGEDRR